MPVFEEIYYEVANTVGEIISEFYTEYMEFEKDDLITFNDCYSKDSSKYEIAVSNNKGGIIRELVFTFHGNKKLFESFVGFFEEYSNKYLSDKEYIFKIQKQSMSIAKINVLYKETHEEN